jgi:hypothetical protein
MDKAVRVMTGLRKEVQSVVSSDIPDADKRKRLGELASSLENTASSAMSEEGGAAGRVKRQVKQALRAQAESVVDGKPADGTAVSAAMKGVAPKVLDEARTSLRTQARKDLEAAAVAGKGDETIRQAKLLVRYGATVDHELDALQKKIENGTLSAEAGRVARTAVYAQR